MINLTKNFASIVLLSSLFFGCEAIESPVSEDDSSTNSPTSTQIGNDDTDDISEIYFLILDEDAIDNGHRYWPGNETNLNSENIRSFSDTEVNDDRSDLARRNQLRYFSINISETLWLWSGEVGDEGWHAPKTIPNRWTEAGPTNSGLRNYLGNPSEPYPHNVGQGLGTGDSPEVRLDEIPNVIPLRAEGLYGLIGKTVCAVVYDSDVSTNYSPIEANLQGENLGTVAFSVKAVKYLSDFSSGTLPAVQIKMLNADVLCEDSLKLYLDAPEPSSSSEPYDVKPNDPSDNDGYK